MTGMNYTSEEGMIKGGKTWTYDKTDNKRIEKTTGNDGKIDESQNLTFVYDDNDSCIEIHDANDVIVKKYEYIKVTVAPDGTVTTEE